MGRTKFSGSGKIKARQELWHQRDVEYHNALNTADPDTRDRRLDHAVAAGYAALGIAPMGRISGHTKQKVRENLGDTYAEIDERYSKEVEDVSNIGEVALSDEVMQERVREDFYSEEYWADPATDGAKLA